MEVVLLIGLQASGKSTFCNRTFFNTHLRLNLDMLELAAKDEMPKQK